MSRTLSMVISIAASGVLLAVLYSRLDVRSIGAALLDADPLWLVVSIALIVPITVVRAIRFLWVAPPGAVPGTAQALRLTLVTSAVNLFAPAKTGDLVKAHFVATRGDRPAGVSIALVIYERLCDLFGLILWCVLGWGLGRPQVPGLPAAFWVLLGVFGGVCGVLILSSRAAAIVKAIIARARPHGRLQKLLTLAEGWPDLLQILGRRRYSIVLLSLGLWLGHLSQIWTFTIALDAPVPFWVCASLSAIALMAGQVPFTLAGLGARDVALVVLMSAYLPPATAAAMGILIATRGLVPALIGLPFIWPYVASHVGQGTKRSSSTTSQNA